MNDSHIDWMYFMVDWVICESDCIIALQCLFAYYAAEIACVPGWNIFD